MSEDGAMEEVAMGRAMDPLAGVAVHGALAPDELVMLAEEAGSAPVEWTLGEVFRRVLCFVFFDGRSFEAGGWDYAAAAVEVLYREFCPSFFGRMAEDASRRRRGVGLVCGAGHGVGELVREVPEEMLAGLLLRLGRELEGGLWLVELTRRFYMLAKVVDESLIGNASLEHLGDVFQEANRKAARARWSARREQVLRVVGGDEAQGVHARYMKCDVARERMRVAQLGNQNRRMKVE